MVENPIDKKDPYTEMFPFLRIFAYLIFLDYIMNVFLLMKGYDHGVYLRLGYFIDLFLIIILGRGFDRISDGMKNIKSIQFQDNV